MSATFCPFWLASSSVNLLLDGILNSSTTTPRDRKMHNYSPIRLIDQTVCKVLSLLQNDCPASVPAFLTQSLPASNGPSHCLDLVRIPLSTGPTARTPFARDSSDEEWLVSYVGRKMQTRTSVPNITNTTNMKDEGLDPCSSNNDRRPPCLQMTRRPRPIFD